MSKLSLKDLSIKGLKVLMRVDFNVPLDKNLKITDDTRIQKALPSIRYVLDNGGSLILMSHLGRPKGKQDPKYSLAPCQKRLAELLQIPVFLAPDCIGEKTEEMAKVLKERQILLLENLRFHKEEEKPDKKHEFAKKLACLADVYVNDAFGAAHRKHSSTYYICKEFPKKCAMGFLLENEVENLNKVLHPQRPFYAIIGGAKVSSKIGILSNLIEKVDALFIGGAMAYTFLKTKNIPIGNSLFEEEETLTCKQIFETANKLKVPIHLPEDHVIADGFSETANIRFASSKVGFEAPWQGMDIGVKTLKSWEKEMQDAQTIFWNGPLGVFEMKPFSKGTLQIAEFLSHLSATTIVGGGDSVAAVSQLNLQNRFSHISTGGGAALEYIEFGTLPAIEALSNKKK